MSHTLSMKNVKIDQSSALIVANYMGWKTEQSATQRFFDGSSYSGTAVQLPGWRYPVIVDSEGEMHYDNYKGRWGDTKDLARLTGLSLAAMQNYSMSLVDEEESIDGQMTFTTMG